MLFIVNVRSTSVCSFAFAFGMYENSGVLDGWFFPSHSALFSTDYARVLEELLWVFQLSQDITPNIVALSSICFRRRQILL